MYLWIDGLLWTQKVDKSRPLRLLGLSHVTLSHLHVQNTFNK